MHNLASFHINQIVKNISETMRLINLKFYRKHLSTCPNRITVFRGKYFCSLVAILN